MKEVIPPWVKYPDFPPYDGSWRQSGELWLIYTWVPFWNSLNPTQKEEYLKQWQVPEVWLKLCHHINPEFGEWLEIVDKE